MPSDNLAKAFDDAVWKKVTMLCLVYVNEDHNTIYGSLVLEGINSKPSHNSKAYVPTPNKFDGLDNFGPQRNFRLLLFSEILLINAEVNSHLGGDAATPLNGVRARVQLRP